MEAPSVSLVGKGKAGQQAAIIFVHGTGGSGATTWDSVRASRERSSAQQMGLLDRDVRDELVAGYQGDLERRR